MKKMLAFHPGTWMRRMTTPLVCVTTVTTRILITTVSAVTALVLLSSVPYLATSGRLARRIDHRAARVTLGLITTTLVTTLMATTSGMMNNWRSLLMDHRWLKFLIFKIPKYEIF